MTGVLETRREGSQWVQSVKDEWRCWWGKVRVSAGRRSEGWSWKRESEGEMKMEGKRKNEKRERKKKERAKRPSPFKCLMSVTCFDLQRL